MKKENYKNPLMVHSRIDGQCDDSRSDRPVENETVSEKYEKTVTLTLLPAYPSLQKNWKITPSHVSTSLCIWHWRIFLLKEDNAQQREKRDRKIEMMLRSVMESTGFSHTRYTWKGEHAGK